MRGLFYILIPAMLLLASCNNRGYSSELLQDENVSLRSNSVLVFSYNPLTCQLAYNAGKNEFRAFTDNMSDYFDLILSSTPKGEGETVTGSLEWTTSNNIQYLTDLVFKVEKMDGNGLIWLWNKERKLFIVVRQL